MRTVTSDKRIATAKSLLSDYAERTGLYFSVPPKRYLWTDALAVCNYLGLHAAEARLGRTNRAAKDEHHDETGMGDSPHAIDLALRLIDQVHHELGRFRDDDVRSGWLSGLSEEEGERHPTRGGLRLGKPLPERATGEPYDPGQECDRDGQCYSTLTRWMHALSRVYEVTGEARYHGWAVELATVAHARFVHAARPGPPLSLYWKMSVDLSRPLVYASGQHDALDGLVTYLALEASTPTRERSALTGEISGLAAIIGRAHWETYDPLCIGSLFVDAYRLGRLVACGSPSSAPDAPELLLRVLDESWRSFHAFLRGRPFTAPCHCRVPFRELGLCLGLHAIEALRTRYLDALTSHSMLPNVALRVNRTAAFLSIATELENFWLDPRNQASPTWIEQRNLNSMMLVSSLLPNGYLGGA